MKTMRHFLAVQVIAGLALFFLIGFPSFAVAQEYPTKPITVYCGFNPGGTLDVMARALATGAEKILGVPM